MRNNIILGGIGVLLLGWNSEYFGVEHTDPIFWYVYVPLAVALGLFIRHSAGRGKD
jgi:hypothetical protein